MLKKSRVAALALCLMMIMGMFAGCGGANGTDTNKSSNAENTEKAKVVSKTAANELVLLFSAENAGLDVQQVTSYDLAAGMLFSPLISLSEDKKSVIPEIAESVELSADAKVITIKLPEGLTFTNGDPLNAEATKASFERLIKLSPLAASLNISKVEATDAKTVVITCSKPSAYLMSALTSSLLGLLDAAAASKVGDQAFLSNPIGYGPYSLKEYIKGSHTTLVRNDKFKTNKPVVQNKGPFNFETIKYRYISNNFTRLSEFISGNADILLDAPIESLGTLRNQKDVTIIERQSPGTNWMLVNPDRFGDIKVREAIRLAVDREELRIAMQNTIVPNYGPAAPNWVGYSKETEDQFKTEYAFNLEKSKALLAEAGYKDTNGDGIVEKDGKPLTVELTVHSTATFVKTVGPVLQTQFQKIGIKVNLKEVDSPTLSMLRMACDYDLLMVKVDSPNYDSSILKQANSLYNLMKNNSNKEKVAQLLEEAQGAADVSIRTAKYSEANKLIMSNATMICLFSPKVYTAIKNNVKGYKLYNNSLLLNDATKE